MLDDRLIELVKATREILDLERSVVEKDYYVTKAIRALSKIDSDNFCLIFAGGTCLAKAHKVVMRMSEDIDFKVKIKNSKAFISKTNFLKQLKDFRDNIIEIISKCGFKVGDIVVRNEDIIATILL